jgi:hypothetical protein
MEACQSCAGWKEMSRDMLRFLLKILILRMKVLRKLSACYITTCKDTELSE